MASTLENALRLVKPGEMVVSVTDILDKIGNKLSDDEKQQLLIAMLSRRTEKVQPGDLISADLLNQIMADIADLRMQVHRLERGSSVSLPPEIFGFFQSQPFYPSEQIDVQGKNFSVPPEKNVVTVDGHPVTQFSSGSTTQLLTLTVPSQLSVYASERQVVLRIENADHLAASTQIRVKERVLPPSGGLPVLYKGGPISTLVAKGRSYEMNYEVRPSTRPELLDYRFETTSTWTAEIFDDEKQVWVNQLNKSLLSGTPSVIRVKVAVPNTARIDDKNDVLLTIVQTTPGTKIGNGTSLTPLIVGKPVPGASDAIAISIKSLPQGTSLRDGRLMIEKPPAGVTPGTLVTFLVTFLSPAEAGTYQFSSVPGNARWSITAQSAVNRPANVPSATEIDVDISADGADAPNTNIGFVLSKTLADGSNFAATHVLAIGISNS